MDDLVEQITTAPVGAALLMHLEMRERTGRWWGFSWAEDVDASAVAAAAKTVESAPIGHLLAEAVLVGQSRAGSWVADAPLQVATALRDARGRWPIARALAARLIEMPAGGRHEWWWSDSPLTDQIAEGMGPLGSVRRPCGAWVTATWDGLWTITEPAPPLADPAVSAWEVYPGPVTRWELTAAGDARTYEVDGPSDWERLVRTHPLARPERPNASWELPGPERMIGAGHPLLAVDDQRAAVTEMRNFVEPDWNSVAEEWDAVHLTWKGFVTTDGLVIELDDGDVAMLRNWHSERTLWLNPVLSDPRPLEAPGLTGVASNVFGADPTIIGGRVEQDLEWLRHKLGVRS